MNQMLKCLCLDDEPLALEVLEAHISRIPGLQLVGKCTHALDALQKIRTEKPDILFCDIQMPEITGLDFVRSIQDQQLLVIFTTAHQEFALDAFELNAIDYLMKPISFERFEKAVNKAREYFDLRKNPVEEKLEADNEFMFVKTDQKLQKIGFSEICYVEAFADYVKIWVNADKRIVTLQTMKKMEGFLPQDRFARIHRSYIVAINKIESISGNEVVVCGKSLPIGKNYKDDFMNRMANRNVLR